MSQPPTAAAQTAPSRSTGPASVRGAGSEDTAPLAALVAVRRAELGLSLRALQARSGVHYSHLSKVESGSDRAGVGALAGLSVGLQMPLSELLQAAGIPAHLGLPSFSGYLESVAPGVSSSTRQKLEAAFERSTGIHPDEPPTHGATEASS